MRENRTYGSEGGEAKAFPTPISVPGTSLSGFARAWHGHVKAADLGALHPGSSHSRR